MKLLIPHTEIVDICKTLGQKINQDYNGKNPVLICVLKGAAPFHSELIKHIETDIEVDYLQVSSYKGTESTGVVTFKKDIDIDIASREVLLVEDLVDSGRTLAKLHKLFLTRGAKSVEIVTLLDKACKRVVPVDVKYVGRVIDDLFVIGFGMDLDEKYRNLKDIFIYNED